MEESDDEHRCRGQTGGISMRTFNTEKPRFIHMFYFYSFNMSQWKITPAEDDLKPVPSKCWWSGKKQTHIDALNTPIFNRIGFIMMSLYNYNSIHNKLMVKLYIFTMVSMPLFRKVCKPQLFHCFRLEIFSVKPWSH